MAVRPVYALLDGVGIIDTDGLQDLAVTTPKLAPSAVTSPKIATDAVTSTHIAANAVGSSEIEVGAVGSAQIATGAIITSKIANGAVGDAQTASNPPSAGTGDLVWARFGGIAHVYTENDGIDLSGGFNISSGFRPIAAQSPVTCAGVFRHVPTGTQIAGTVRVFSNGDISVYNVGNQSTYPASDVSRLNFSISYEIGG